MKEGSSNHRFHQVLLHFQSALYRICEINPKDPGNVSSGVTGENVTLKFLNVPTKMAVVPKAALRLLLQYGRGGGFPKAYIQRRVAGDISDALLMNHGHTPSSPSEY